VRSLSPDEAELWAKVAATIKPLSRDRPEPQPAEIPPQPAASEPARKPVQPRPPRVVPAPAPRVGATLDGSWDRRLSGGLVEPDRVVDLHGKTLDGAWRAIDRSLEQAIDAGDRVVLLITGHHRPGEPPIRRGAIRAAVHDWLAASRHAPRIAAVRGAHRRHGGGGSLYLILRRR
jgi:DNA-nicking Smr family endonuclease